MEQPKKIVIVKNIPSPYRNKLFNTMQEIFPQYNLAFEVWYLAKTEPNRLWKLNEKDFKYSFKYLKGIHPKIGNMFAHFNFSLIPSLLIEKYDLLIIGGYGSPSLMLAPFFSRNQTKKILWSETNTLSVSAHNSFSKIFKSKIINLYDAFLVPGDLATKYLCDFVKQEKVFIKLPNLIDEEKFINQIDIFRKNREALRAHYLENGIEQIWLLPAQLERKKGIIQFLEGLANIKNVHLLIAGEGRLRPEIEKTIIQNKLKVSLLGFLQQEELLKLYALADLFVLPSISDPSPLSVIEAIAAGLPIIVSNRIGNFPEVLNQNGWEYDPYWDFNKKSNLILSIASSSSNELMTLGARSRNQYLQKFDTKKTIHQLALSLKNHIS